MKNIFILPTDKPSRLYFWTGNNIYKSQFRLRKIAGFCTNNETTTNQYIYITSDEKIEDGDYGISKLNEVVKYYNGYGYKHYKKIILTTDLDLIKDGVQEIDDEFLEWFTNNPSCEEIEVNKFPSECSCANQARYKKDANIIEDDNTCHLRNNCETIYKIIIPKEEPKQDLEKEMFELEQELDIPSHLRWHNSKPKKEIPEEKAEAYARLVWGMYYDNEYDTGTDLTYGEVSKNDFLAGVEYQKQQNKNIYSEEDLREAFRQGQENITYDEMYGYNSDITEDAFIKRFNLQFKK